MVAKKEMVYVELWFDAEKLNKWKLTVWYIDGKDFDPFTTEYETLENEYLNIHTAKKAQDELVTKIRSCGLRTYTNNYNPDSYFWLRPAWLERLISNV